MVSDRICKTLDQKSRLHQLELKRLRKAVENAPLSKNVMVLKETPQIKGINALLLDPDLPAEDFIFYFDRLVCILIDKATETLPYAPKSVHTPQNYTYDGLQSAGSVSAVVVLRGGSILETGLHRTLPSCLTGRILIQTSHRTGEPELHYLKLPQDIATHDKVLLLDPQMSSGGAALMAVRVLVDHGVQENRICFVCYMAGQMGLNRVMSVFPEIQVVVVRVVNDVHTRWVEERYLGC
ncbi:Uridine kinase [Elasticomyces elasticus]|nr:Uridine kinase [Elasticomyces elasticus]